MDLWAELEVEPRRIEVAVSAIFSRQDGSQATTREVYLYRRGDYVWMRGGPTGYELLPANAEFAGRDWCACAGTDGRWAMCVVPVAEMERAFRVLGAG